MSTVDQAARAAEAAFEEYSALPGARVADFLESIAEEILALGADLTATACRESALPQGRIEGERGRTVGQIRMFAEMARSGAWKDVRIDAAMPDRKPLPRADLRRTMLPIGPVAVWAASNFPLAFSVAGGDTASALAAGCPVVLKAHPAHPETSDMVAGAIARAVAKHSLPAGVFSMVHGASPDVSLELVRHPAIAAGAFTGSLRAGRVLFDAANQRPEPIPFFAEMGSVNPIFLLPGVTADRASALADGIVNSVTLGVGQFCTCPGLVIGLADEPFVATLRGRFEAASCGVMLTPGIAAAYREGLDRAAGIHGLRVTRASAAPGERQGQPALLECDAATFLKNVELRNEIFGPSTIFVACRDESELEQVARSLEGSLTATIHGTPEGLAAHGKLLRILQRKAGRLIFNGYPTGVEVCQAMQHGGPYPATTDPRFTSVGSAAIQRFARPVCYQDFPLEALPPELRG